MKTKKLTTTTILTILLISFSTYGQRLVKNEIDEFTGESIKETSWATISASLFEGFFAYYRFTKINETYYFNFKLIDEGKVFSIDKGQEFLFKLENNDILKLVNPKTKLTCYGCGSISLVGSEAEGVEVAYPISKQQLETLKKFSPAKFRVYVDEKHIEKTIRPKFVKNFYDVISLII
ncbi:hypothetical protein LG651_09870 [Tamlana sp. 62-3]|uniref:Uncharacterized protein n=1 Tax=Neotamlana sargassicola TaxID=2883125 RepID=A0A9X1I9E7_9FLAO|nr:hypothetical protein [Tamlana sargassicola]MCB4808561.1 hypothetical protein [Tamlana sargassicola]